MLSYDTNFSAENRQLSDINQTWVSKLFLRSLHYAVVTPLRKDASYEPRITILGIWGDTWQSWLTCGKYGIYVAVRGSYGVYVTPSGT